MNDPDPTPTLERLREVVASLDPHVLRTPTVPWPATDAMPSPVGDDLVVKLELLQRTGSFKARGALNAIRSEPDASAGAVAFSAGNHAIAAAWAGRALGVDVTVVMPRSANPARVARVRALGGRIVFGETIDELVGIVETLRADEGRFLVHPFEGPRTVEGTAGVALELLADAPELDAVVVPVGGGGLIAGIASAVHRVRPECRVYGVEPVGADGMRRSLELGAPLARVAVDTIADSLGAPLHLPLTYALVERHVHRIVTVTDDEMRAAMRGCFDAMKLAVEPACAAGLAALSGPLRSELDGARVGLVACGSNIDLEGWTRLALGA